MSKYKEPKIRISKVYTKKGDDGSTYLIGGEQVSKNDIRVIAYGEIDELNVYVGVSANQLKNHSNSEEINYCIERLESIQKELFNLGTVLASTGSKLSKGFPSISENDILILENDIDKMNKELDSLESFILPGGNKTILNIHLARVVCRRAERNVVTIIEKYNNLELPLKYLNRLSDYLFVLARFISKKHKIQEQLWNPNNITSSK